MTIIWNPSGSLNIAHDASDLPETADQFDVTSGAMVRCKNLRIDQKGMAKTRDGSAKLNSTAIATPVWWIEEQAGTRYSFAGSAIYSDESSIATGLTAAQWSAIKYNAFNDTTQNVFALNGVDRKRIESGTVYEWGIDAPTAAPVAAVGSASGLTGSYVFRYTYARKVGSTVVAESDPSPVSNTVSLANEKAAVTVTAPTDSQVTHIRLYRTPAGGSTYLYDQDVAVGTTSFVSSQADGVLGDEVETDHDRPPLGSYVFGPAYDGTCFIIKDNLLYYCKPKQPEYWPPTYFIEVSTPQLPGKTAVFYNGQPYYFSAVELYYIQGTGHGTFFPIPMRAKTGAQSIRGAVSVAGKGIYHTGPDGIYLFSSGADVKVTEETLEPLFRGEDTQGMPGVADMSSGILWSYRNNLYFAYRSSGYTYPTNVLVMNLDTSRVSYHEYNEVEFTATAIDNHNKRLLVGDNDGYVRVIESVSHQDDAGEDIEFEVQSKDFILQTRRHFPRWVKYDVNASEADECTGELLLAGQVHHSHTLNDNRNTRRRLVGEGNGNRAAIRISGRGQVSIYSAESE